MILSICIPTFKRVYELRRALESIDVVEFKKNVEIVICENCSANRMKVRDVVQKFRNATNYDIKYYENETNIGYDRNVKKLIEYANGKYIVFLSDDDQFIPNMLDELCKTLITTSADVIIHGFKYLNYGFLKNTKTIQYENKTYDIGNSKQALVENFEKMSLISGLCGKKEELHKYISNNNFDGTLFNQVFIFGSVILNGTVLLSDKLLVYYCGDGEEVFGESENERYISNKISSLNMQKRNISNLSIANYFDETYCLSISERIEPMILKAEHSNLLIMKAVGRTEFVKYHKTNLLNYTFIPLIYYLEYFTIFIFGEKLVRRVLIFFAMLKRKKGN